MNRALKLFLRVCVIVFLDNIIVYSSLWFDHLWHLDKVLTALAWE